MLKIRFGKRGRIILDTIKIMCIVMVVFCTVQIFHICYEGIEEYTYKRRAAQNRESMREKILKAVPQKYRNILQNLCVRYNIPLHIIVPLVEVESEWNQDNRGINCDSIDIGLCQINSKNRVDFEREFPGYSIFIDVHNLEIGMWFLRKLHNVHGDWYSAVCAYNAGSSSVFNNRLPPSTQRYVKKIFTREFN